MSRKAIIIAKDKSEDFKKFIHENVKPKEFWEQEKKEIDKTELDKLFEVEE